MNERSKPIPVTILGGSDLRAGRMPEGEEDAHPLAAYKGAALRVRGRPVMLVLRDVLGKTPGFGPVTVAGPARVYAGVHSAFDEEPLDVVDVDADVSTNLRAAIDAHDRRFGDEPIAILTCDVLPSPEELEDVLRDYAVAPSALVYPLIRAPEDAAELGAFGWKPEYAIRPAPGEDAVDVLPGHLLIARPRALRLELIYRLLDAAYRTRNRPVAARRKAMLRSTLGGLFVQDLLHVASLRRPDLTWTVVRHGLRLVRELRSGELTLTGLEEHVARMLIAARYRRRHPDVRVRLPLLDALGLAEDIDTEEEARSLGLELEQPPDVDASPSA